MTTKQPMSTISAVMSGCDRYRWHLLRVWNHELPNMVWVMLNPSTADGITDDPTIRKCIGFARELGFGSISVVNLFGWRSTNPDLLADVIDPVGDKNDEWISSAIAHAGMVICAWGKHGSLLNRDAEVREMIRAANVTAHYLRLNKDGSPGHPLYIPYTAQPVPWYGVGV